MQNNEFLQTYNKTMEELEKLIKSIKKNPGEREWNKYASQNGYLLSNTISYVSGKKFNKICSELIKMEDKL